MNDFDIIVTQDEEGNLYSNESLLKGILHHTRFDAGYGDAGGAGHIGKGARADVIRMLGFSDHPTKEECWSKMKSFKLEAYPEFTFTVHKDLVGEVQNIYKELKELGVILNKYQGSYCYRPINNPNHKGSKILSMHSFGCAIDLNYNLNPFSKRPQLKNDDVKNGVVRTIDNPIVKVFAKYGWGWGGRYYDYMHFSKANGA